MRIAILGNNRNSFVKPISEGLKRMFSQCGVEAEVYYRGHFYLSNVPIRSNSFKSLAGSTLKRIVHYVSFLLFVRELSKFDVVVVAGNVPSLFLRNAFTNIELLRKLLPKTPIVYYGQNFLPTIHKWGAAMLKGEDTLLPFEEPWLDGGIYGLERYDWYLVASVVSEIPLPDKELLYSLIGVNIDDGTLYPEDKEEFIALLDFERPAYNPQEREIQIQALEETGTRYMILEGRYSIEEIRDVYRKCSIHFPAFRESFGLPICELQACGSYVFIPYAEWAGAHWIKSDLRIAGPGTLSPNFIVYDNDKDKLVREINRIKSNYDPRRVHDTFLSYHPQLFHGDTKELRRFVEMVKDREIHADSHQQYINLF